MNEIVPTTTSTCGGDAVTSVTLFEPPKEFEAFEAMTRRIVQVPKTEVDAEREKD